MTIKRRVYGVIEGKTFSKFIYGLIVFNVFAIILETNEGLRNEYAGLFNTFEYVSILVFSMEYLIRIWVADVDQNGTTLFGSKRLGYMFSGYGIIDLIAILPFYLPLVITFDLRIVRILRLFRLLRILKLGKYSKSLKIIKRVLQDTKPQLSVTVFVAWILLVLASTLMFYAENGAQPDKFSSIADSLWWAVATLTTVGYGDVYPVTPLGKVLSAVIALIGIGFIALPTGILSSAFIENVEKERIDDRYCKCPICGEIFKNSTEGKDA
ncbi:ion transporter [Flagellimonas oceanensis]|uniref:ion transporter n=1 Tax=Flagellimonas oceanensis TaxID=2499163 RepID=UPI003BA93A9E